MPESDLLKDIQYMRERLKAQGLGSRDPVIILRGNDAVNYERLINQELNRLRSEVDRLDFALDKYIEEVAETRAENKKLMKREKFICEKGMMQEFLKWKGRDDE